MMPLLPTLSPLERQSIYTNSLSTLCLFLFCYIYLFNFFDSIFKLNIQYLSFCLTLLIITLSRYINVLQTEKLHSFYVCILLIFSSVDGHLDYFHVLAIVNNDVMNFVVHISFQSSVFVLDIYPEVEILDHMVILFLIF